MQMGMLGSLGGKLGGPLWDCLFDLGTGLFGQFHLRCLKVDCRKAGGRLPACPVGSWAHGHQVRCLKMY